MREIKGFTPPEGIVVDEMQPGDVLAAGAMEKAIEEADGRTVPVTFEGVQIGTAVLKEIPGGLDVEATIEKEYDYLVAPDGREFSIAEDEVKVIDTEHEVAELFKMTEMLTALQRLRGVRKPGSPKIKEKTQRRAKNKAARKSRRGNH